MTEIGPYAFYNCGQLAKVFYAGVLEQWETIQIGDNNAPLAGASIRYNARPVFDDVRLCAYYADAVAWAKETGVTKGKSDTEFAPADTVTRGQAVTFLWRTLGSPAAAGTENRFADVPAGEYYTDAVLWAVENGVTVGTSDTEFSPEAPVTNVQMLTFLARAMGETVIGDDWKQAALNWAAESGLLEGLPDAPAADDPCPRSDVVFFLWRAFAGKG